VLVGNANLGAFILGFNQRGIRDLGFNLLLASAFSVLELVLRQLRHEAAFSSSRDSLGAMMAGSGKALPWLDFATIDAARTERNASIHQRHYLPHARCRDHIAAIERELVNWRILVAATPRLWHW
jgi:hypothetical protein